LQVNVSGVKNLETKFLLIKAVLSELGTDNPAFRLV